MVVVVVVVGIVWKLVRRWGRRVGSLSRWVVEMVVVMILVVVEVDLGVVGVGIGIGVVGSWYRCSWFRWLWNEGFLCGRREGREVGAGGFMLLGERWEWWCGGLFVNGYGLGLKVPGVAVFGVK